MQSASSQEITTNQLQTNGDFVKSQPLLVVSSIGAALGSLRVALRKLKNLPSIRLPKLPSYAKIVPKYLRSNYVKYPAIFIILLASTRRLRTILDR